MEKAGKETQERLIASNPTARSDYFIHEVVEAGIVLTGTEVKSLRLQAPHLRETFVDLQPHRSQFEAWLVNIHIGPYSHGNIWNHEPLRRRKLLLHKHQLQSLYGSVIQKGMTIIPLRMYFKKSRVKVELGVCRGKKKFDKRETLKKRAVEREMEIEVKRNT
jgi:SsrA-binding protein